MPRSSPPQRHPVDGDLHEVGKQANAGKRREHQSHIEIEARQGTEAPAQYHAAPGEIVVLGPEAGPEQKLPQFEYHKAVQQHEGEVAEQQAADDPPAQTAPELGQQGLEHGGAQCQYQYQAGEEVGEVETLLRQSLQDLAEFSALGSICQQQADPQLIATGEGIVRCPQGAVEIQGAAPFIASLAFFYRLAQLIYALPFVVEQLHPHLVPRLQRFEQLPLAAYHQIEATVVTLVEQRVTSERRYGLVGRSQHQRPGLAEPAAGIDLRQYQGQQQQRSQQAKQQGRQAGDPG